MPYTNFDDEIMTVDRYSKYQTIFLAMFYIVIVLSISFYALRRPTTCDGVTLKRFAQHTLESNPIKYAGLDPDHDGVACNEGNLVG